ncbi:DUF4443 domain-containing protein [Palaeococcus ferrophilus]|uniref:DUF4443 domain-containing protein n=1 Tax=Palaeococcus ferrophilus TaxID=83868 RepID=UPI00064E5C7D|nr:DUF4443 domain-containing protein [Palaeococcus ferrophilus]
MSWKRGAYPEYELEDVIAAIFALKETKGRKQLAEGLGLGEGSVRTLLKKLSSLGLIESKQRGHHLSDKGESVLGELAGKFSEPVPVSPVEGMPSRALKIHGPPTFKSIDLRDEAIRAGAKGAMILRVKDGEPVFPEDGRPLRETLPELAEELMGKLNPSEGDALVISWAEEPHVAVKSAIHVAVFLRDEVPRELAEVVG